MLQHTQLLHNEAAQAEAAKQAEPVAAERLLPRAVAAMIHKERIGI